MLPKIRSSLYRVRKLVEKRYKEAVEEGTSILFESGNYSSRAGAKRAAIRILKQLFGEKSARIK